MDQEEPVAEAVPEANYQPILDPVVQQDYNMSSDKFLKGVRYVNIAAGLFVSFVGFWILVSLQIFNSDHKLASFFTFWLPFFYILGGLLLIAAEFYKHQVDTYFLFLRYFLGRGMFNIFLATQTAAIGGVVGGLFRWTLFILGIVYIFLHFLQDYMSNQVRQQLLE